MINNNEGIIELPKSCRTCVWFASHPYDTDEGFCFHDKSLIINLSACEDVDCEYHKYFYYEKEVCHV